MMGSLAEANGKKMGPNHLDPFVIELNRLVNSLKEKERELGAAYCEIKALKVTEVLKDKAVVELSNELKKLEIKLRNAEKQIEEKNLEIKKVTNEKKEAIATQFAAEAALRRVHANQKDEESVPVEAIIAPYESDIRNYKIEIASLQEDRKALERLIKSKEVALLEAEKILHSAQERALMVDNLENQNIELERQIEICQEENRLLEKANRQKVLEVEKLSQTIRELEESILAGGAVANMVRDYQRQVSDLNEEKKTLERELARAKVSANRVATVVANEWKDEGDKVIPLKQWMEERKFLQGEIQRLKDKLAISERSLKAETQLRDKFKMRLKTLEEGLKGASSLSVNKPEKSEQVNESLSCNVAIRKRSTSQPRASVASSPATSVLRPPSPVSGRRVVRSNSFTKKSGLEENLVRRNLWVPRSKFLDDRGKENTEAKVNSNRHKNAIATTKQQEVPTEGKASEKEEVSEEEAKAIVKEEVAEEEKAIDDRSGDDSVSGFLYDRLQKEVIIARKLLEEKDGALDAKDNEIKLLQRKIDALTRAMEVESKKMRREATARQKETSVSCDDSKQKMKNSNLDIFKRSVKPQNT